MIRTEEPGSLMEVSFLSVVERLRFPSNLALPYALILRKEEVYY